MEEIFINIPNNFFLTCRRLVRPYCYTTPSGSLNGIIYLNILFTDKETNTIVEKLSYRSFQEKLSKFETSKLYRGGWKIIGFFLTYIVSSYFGEYFNYRDRIGFEINVRLAAF